MHPRKYFGQTCLARVLSTVFILASFSVSAGAESSPRVIVVGEVQGAVNCVAQLLSQVGVIDEERRWIGGDTIVIQTGDLMDGGADVRATLDCLMRLQKEATAAGGQVIVLLGNHEAMNILGEYRDVNYASYQSFAGPESESRQHDAYQAFIAWRTKRAEITGSEPSQGTDGGGEEWKAAHPPGWIEYAESMSKDGIYGRWLRTLPVAFAMDDTLFIHAGISQAMKGMDADAINHQALKEIKRYDEVRKIMTDEGLIFPFASLGEMVDVVKEEIGFVNSLRGASQKKNARRIKRTVKIEDFTKVGSWSLLSVEGPLWFPGTTKWNEGSETAQMEEILNQSGFERMITGQSAGRKQSIEARFNDRVILASTKMSDDPWSKSNPAALEIVGGELMVVTLQGREKLVRAAVN